MPTYVYACQACGRVIERRQSFQDEPLTECEQCHGVLRRVMQPVGIIFKGSGFYSTDYKAGSASSIPENARDGAQTEPVSAKEPVGPGKESAAPVAVSAAAGESGSSSN